MDVSTENQSQRLIKIFVARLKEVAGEKFNSEALSEELKASNVEITGQGLRNLRDGKWLPKVEVLYGIAKHFNKPMEWFLGEEEHRIAWADNISPTIVLSSEVRDKPEIKLEDYYAAPLLAGKIAAGAGYTVESEAIRSLVWIYAPELRDRWKHNLVAVQIDDKTGDSMLPTLYPSDIVLIDRDDPGEEISRFRDGAIYAIRTERGEAWTAVKRLYFDKNKKDLVITSDNRAYPPEIAWTRNITKLIIGRVVWGWRNLLEV